MSGESGRHPCPYKVLCHLLPAAPKGSCKCLPALSKVPVAVCTGEGSTLVGSAQCQGLPERATPPGHPSTALPALAQQEPLPRGHSGVLRSGTMCPCPLALQPVSQCPRSLPAGGHLRVPIPALHPSLALIPPGTGVPACAATQGAGCWVLPVPHMGTWPLTPPGLLPVLSFTPASPLTSCSSSP